MEFYTLKIAGYQLVRRVAVSDTNLTFMKINRRRFLEQWTKLLWAIPFLPVIVKLFQPSARARAVTDSGHGRLPRTDGYGACSLCKCPSYVGIQDTCGNCGHAYWYHG